MNVLLLLLRVSRRANASDGGKAANGWAASEIGQTMPSMGAVEEEEEDDD